MGSALGRVLPQAAPAPRRFATRPEWSGRGCCPAGSASFRRSRAAGVLGHPGGEGQRCGSGERDAEFVHVLCFHTMGAHISWLKHPIAVEGARGYRIPLPPPLGSQVCTRRLSLSLSLSLSLIKTGSSSSVLCDLLVSLKVKRVSSGPHTRWEERGSLEGASPGLPLCSARTARCRFSAWPRTSLSSGDCPFLPQAQLLPQPQPRLTPPLPQTQTGSAQGGGRAGGRLADNLILRTLLNP